MEPEQFCNAIIRREKQEQFHNAIIRGDIDEVKSLWKQDRVDIPNNLFAKSCFNNLVIRATTVSLTTDKKLAKWLDHNRIDKSLLERRTNTKTFI